MAMSADKRSKFAAPHRQWWRLHMSEKFSIGTKTPQKTNRNIQAWISNPETLKIRNQPHKHTRLLAYEKSFSHYYQISHPFIIYQFRQLCPFSALSIKIRYHYIYIPFLLKKWCSTDEKSI